MRHRVTLRIIFVMCVCAASAASAFACQCGGSYFGRSDWEMAKLVTGKTNFVFEGTPVRWELKWSLLSARDGEVIPADFFMDKDSHDPLMAITFRVLRAYKGELGNEVTLYTGIGGGDCAATYATGLNYLIYAYGSDTKDLGVSMCSPGGWIGSDETATYLRYLRKDRPSAADLGPITRWLSSETPEQQKRREQAREEERKRYKEATGRICGRIEQSGASEYSGSVAFLSTRGYSPAAWLDATIKDDGSFCSMDLGPGKYYLYFVRRSDDGATAVYYPGVSDVAKATEIEVTAGQTISNVTFKLPRPVGYSVRGFISANQKLDFGNNAFGGLTVLLIRTDGDRRVWYSGKATMVLPKTAYFKISDVVPGRYAACVWAPAQGWMARKAEVNVTSHMKFVDLELVHKK